MGYYMAYYTPVRSGAADGVPLFTGCIGPVKFLAALSDALQRFVHVHVMVGTVNHAAGNVGAMVPHPLQVGQQVRPDKSGIDSAIPLLQPQDMVRAQLLLQVVDNLL